MQSANLSGPLKGRCLYKALIGLTQASGLAGGFDFDQFVQLGAYAITIRLDGTLGSQPGVLSVSCLSYNGRSNWLARLCLGFYARNEDCQPSSHCSVRFEQVEP